VKESSFLTLYVAVLGALIGKQKGRNLEIMNSFELMFHVMDSSVMVDREYYTTKEDQCKYYGLPLIRDFTMKLKL